ncbi:hypothetical protein ACH50O_02865 [Methylomonas sp. 2BW1-5-20]|uniref:hypothetical protein n=1 Tax=Methylomonas sp. 2BW1-5-20 TaxID=3376686 RepID=UPI00404EBEDA
MAKGNSQATTPKLARLRAEAEWMREHPGIYPMEHWLRLPLALGKAGQFNEAIIEFHRLLDEVDWRLNIEVPRQRPGGDPPRSAFLEKFGHLSRFQIYEQMSLACKRQNLVIQAKQYALLADQHYQEYLDMSVESYHFRSTHEHPATTDI